MNNERSFKERTYLKEVDMRIAIFHALEEAYKCIDAHAFCACLVMIRKAIDLWSSWYRDQHGMTFNKQAREKDDLYWRLAKIAAANPLYDLSIHHIIDALRLEANSTVHDPIICTPPPGNYGPYKEVIIKPYQDLHAQVTTLIISTLPR